MLRAAKQSQLSRSTGMSGGSDYLTEDLARFNQ
jgi:hypothetical protein